jgi:hypothetical protein
VRLHHAIHNADGNVMIHNAQLLVIQYVKDPNVKFTAKRLLVLPVRFIVISHNVMFVVQRIFANQLIVQSVKLFALQLSVVLLVLHQMLFVHQCAKRLNAIGNARSQLSALVLNVNSSVRNQLVKLSNVLLHQPTILAVLVLNRM